MAYSQGQHENPGARPHEADLVPDTPPRALTPALASLTPSAMALLQPGAGYQRGTQQQQRGVYAPPSLFPGFATREKLQPQATGHGRPQDQLVSTNSVGAPHPQQHRAPGGQGLYSNSSGHPPASGLEPAARPLQGSVCQHGAPVHQVCPRCEQQALCSAGMPSAASPGRQSRGSYPNAPQQRPQQAGRESSHPNAQPQRGSPVRPVGGAFLAYGSGQSRMTPHSPASQSRSQSSHQDSGASMPSRAGASSGAVIHNSAARQQHSPVNSPAVRTLRQGSDASPRQARMPAGASALSHQGSGQLGSPGRQWAGQAHARGVLQPKHQQHAQAGAPANPASALPQMFRRRPTPWARVGDIRVLITNSTSTAHGAELCAMRPYAQRLPGMDNRSYNTLF